MFGNAPELYVDKEGKWFADGVHMFRLEIVKLFSEHINKQTDGSYKVLWDGKDYPLKVEDVPFVIDELILAGDKIKVRLTDSRTVDFEAKEINFKNDIAYTSLFFKDDARFSRKAQWQLNSYLTEENGKTYLDFPGKKIPVMQK